MDYFINKDSRIKLNKIFKKINSKNLNETQNYFYDYKADAQYLRDYVFSIDELEQQMRDNNQPKGFLINTNLLKKDLEIFFLGPIYDILKDKNKEKERSAILSDLSNLVFDRQSGDKNVKETLLEFCDQAETLIIDFKPYEDHVYNLIGYSITNIQKPVFVLNSLQLYYDKNLVTYRLSRNENSRKMGMNVDLENYLLFWYKTVAPSFLK